MSSEFNSKEFDKRVSREYDAHQTYLKQAKDKKERALLHTNYFQDCLKNSMERTLQSKEARRIPVKIIISILEDRKILSPTKAKDAIKICDIRDWFTHRVNIKSIEDDVEKLIRTMDIEHTDKEDTTYEKRDTNIMIRGSEKINSETDLYEKIELICLNLSKITRNQDPHHHQDIA